MDSVGCELFDAVMGDGVLHRGRVYKIETVGVCQMQLIRGAGPRRPGEASSRLDLCWPRRRGHRLGDVPAVAKPERRLETVAEEGGERDGKFAGELAADIDPVTMSRVRHSVAGSQWSSDERARRTRRTRLRSEFISESSERKRRQTSSFRLARRWRTNVSRPVHVYGSFVPFLLTDNAHHESFHRYVSFLTHLSHISHLFLVTW
jgi:hypothetical protein